MSEVTVDSRYFHCVRRAEALKVLHAVDDLTRRLTLPRKAWSKKEREAYQLVVRRLKQWGPKRA